MAFNLGGAATGGLGGAAAGATLGSIFPGIGTAIGAGVGGLGGLLAGGLTGNKGKFEQTPNMFNPQQQNILNAFLQQGQQAYNNPYGGFEPIEEQARLGFANKTIPSLAERFTSMGGAGTGALSSPAFASQLGQAGAGLESELAALRSHYGHQGQQNALQLLSMGLAPQTQQYYAPGDAGIGPQLLGAGAGAASNYFGYRAVSDQMGKQQSGSPQISNDQLAQLLLLLRRR